MYISAAIYFKNVIILKWRYLFGPFTYILICKQRCYLKYKLFGGFFVKIINIPDEELF